MITRFAPSPTGYLHLGHAFAAKAVFDYGGTCLLRIEDIDFTRCRPEYTQAIYEDLTWLGFKWPEPVRIQSEHSATYTNVIEDLRNRGLVYRCFKTRKELAQGVHKSTSQSLSIEEENTRIAKGESFAWRLNMSSASGAIGPLSYKELGLSPGVKQVSTSHYGDVVLARKDIGTSYLIACTYDDAMQGVTHVMRGADFIELTGIQRILQTLMGWPEPIYHHHTLLTNETGKKLAKRNKDTSIRELRAQGLSPSDVLDMATAAAKG